MRIYYLHGNLQSFDVWAPIIDQLSKLRPELSHSPVNLHQRRYNGFDDWTEDFCHRVESEANGEQSILLGYSLGGRLALHACLSRPDLWKSAIIVGADPGLESEEEKKLQLDKDRKWAERLKREPLEKLVDEWDAQPVFGGIENQAPRNLGEMDPKRLSQHFEVFSKGIQQNLLPKLAELKNLPILFISGEKDQKYQKIGEELAKSSSAVLAQVVVDAGHRVPWENPKQFVQTLGKFINSLNTC